MAIAEKRSYSVDLQKGAEHAVLRAPLATMDNQAHIFEVQVNDGGAAADLSGAVCEAYFIRADGVTVMLDGVVSGNTASVTLGANCYAVPGRFELAVKLTQGDTVHTILRVEGSVTTSRTDAMTGAGSGVHSFDQLEGKIDAALDGLSRRDRVEDLLINGDFRNPVNQRGKTSYTGNVYGIDRWIGRNALQTLEVRGPDVTITANSASSGWPGLRQKIANIAKYAGKTVTFAVRLYSSVGAHLRFTNTDNELIASCPLGANKTTETLVLTATVPDDATPDSFFPDILLAGSTSDSYMCLYWAALYVGKYTAETLPAYVPRGYAAELTECRRYFRRKETAIVPTYVGANQSSLVFIIENDEPFRTMPNMNLEAIAWIRGEGKNITTIPSWTVSRYTANNVNPSFSVEFGSSLGLSIYGAAFVYCTYSLDAEL